MRSSFKQLFVAAAFLAAAAAGMSAQGAPPAGAPAGGGQGGARGGGRGPAGPPFVLSSPTVTDFQLLPAKFGCQATPPNVSPALTWTNAPAATQSFVVTLHDLDPRPGRGTMPFAHWWIWNIPGTATSLPEAIPAVAELPDGSRQTPSQLAGATIAYRSPCPPAPQVHHYVFDVFAIDTKLDAVASGASRDDLFKAMETHVIGHSSLVVPFHN